jgi:glycosyltransferase involved in cell wall biosynthesis
MMQRKMGIFWQCFGPYHYARLKTLQNTVTDWSIVPIEVSENSSTYPWAPKLPFDKGVITLFPGAIAEDICPIKLYLVLVRFILKNKLQVLFVPSYWPAYSLAASIASLSCNVPVVVMTDSHSESGRNEWLKIAAKRIIISLYSSAFVAGSVHYSYLRQLGVPSWKIFDGYDAIDNEYFATYAFKARSNIEEVRKKHSLPTRFILSVGRFVAKKNLFTIIRAYSAVCRSGNINGHHLVFVGAGPERVEMERIAIELGLKILDHSCRGFEAVDEEWMPTIHFYPFTQIENLPEYYALATCFVLASTVEEWGLVVNEAMACSCPVLVSNTVGAAHDLVIHERTGYRFCPRKPKELADALVRICSDLGIANYLGINSRNLIAEWSLTRFSNGCVAAANVAVNIELAREVNKTYSNRALYLIQSVLPSYRKDVFVSLAESLGSNFELYAGNHYFNTNIGSITDKFRWWIPTCNLYLLKRRFLWQSNVIRLCFVRGVVVFELNPRILSSWLILFVRHLLQRPIVAWGHVDSRFPRSFIRVFLRRTMVNISDAIIVYNEEESKKVIARYPEKPVFVAPNASIVASRFQLQKSSCENLNSILYVGRLDSDKKPLFLLNGFLLARHLLPPDVKLFFIGEGDQMVVLQKIVYDLGLVERVFFIGAVHSIGDLSLYYKNAFCSVSPGYSGLSIIQSLSNGVPMLIGDNEPHSPEIHTDVARRYLELFKSDSVQSLADAIFKMWQSRLSWLSKRSEISEATLKQYCVEKMVEGVLRVMETSL